MPITSEKRADLREAVEQSLRDLSGAGPRLVKIHSEPLASSTCYVTYRVVVDFANGTHVALFAKDFAAFQKPREDIAQRALRERNVYRDLLSQPALGTARYSGSVWDESQSRYWLFLEFVIGTPVKYCGFEYWPLAAQWLGRLHGHFSQKFHSLNSYDYLLQLDADFFRHRAQSACDAVFQVAPDLAKTVIELVRRYDPFVDEMDALPTTLVHGGYRPKNVIVDTSDDVARVCPIDWEMAGCGPSLFDLTALCDGFESDQLEQLFDAYSETALKFGAHVPHRQQLHRLFRCFRLHRKFIALGNSARKGYSPETVANVVRDAEELVDTIR